MRRVRSTGIGWGMGRVGQFFGPFVTGRLVPLGYTVGGIFYAAAVPCFIGALFLVLLMVARPKDGGHAYPKRDHGSLQSIIPKRGFGSSATAAPA